MLSPRAAAALLLLLTLGAGGAGSVEALFGAPVKLNAPGTYGYEPTIDLARDGRLFVSAHRGSVANEGDRLSSFVWASVDGGATWRELPSPLGLRDALYSFEGDIDLDDAGTVYFADTYGSELWLSASADGRAWDRTTPLVTAATFNDRPWLAAQGDGTLHLVSTAIGTRSTLADPLGGAVSYYRSTDGGLTWTLGWVLRDALFCHLSGSPVDARDLAILCATGMASEFREVVHRSLDGGLTWTSETIFEHEGASPATSFVSISHDATGALYSAFIDGRAGGDRLLVAHQRSAGEAWQIDDVTPFVGTIRKAWTAAAGDSRAATCFYATRDTSPGPASEWHVYALASRGPQQPSAVWALARVDPTPVTTRAVPPQDFMQCALSEDGTMYVAYARDAPLDPAHMLPPAFDADILVARGDPTGRTPGAP